jgi:hypothetical protein
MTGRFRVGCGSKPVGAELARDSAGSTTINVELSAAIASKLGSYRDCGVLACDIGATVGRQSKRLIWHFNAVDCLGKRAGHLALVDSTAMLARQRRNDSGRVSVCF